MQGFRLNPNEIEILIEEVLRRLLKEGLFRVCPECGHRAGGNSSCSSSSASPQALPVPVTSAHPHPGRLLSEDELVRYYREGIRVLSLAPRCLVTPAARDRARDLQVDLIQD